MDIEVVRDELSRARVVDSGPPAEPADGEAAFRIDSFALTANNVTYGAVGDMIGYWKFYPASEEGWGRIPVWGYGEAVASRADGVAVGDRFYGFWPMSTHVVLQPANVSPAAFTDGAAHRAELPAIYNRYQRASPDFDAHAEALTALLRPLFGTSFLIDAWLADEDVFGAESVVIASASSKTALGLAHLLRSNKRAAVVGLTSSSNVEFVESTGAYDRVVWYDDLPAGLGETTAVFVDFAGNADIVAAVHRHFGDRLMRSVGVGFTHRAGRAAGDLPGPAPEFFFAPDHIARRMEQWGGAGTAERIDAARADFDATVGPAIDIVDRSGPDEIIDTWQQAVDGGLDPRLGIICTW